jgi:hypothetical protein
MLHDPETECTCDGDGCQESIMLPMDWTTGGYDLSEDKAAGILESDHGWVIINGKHYCWNCQPKQKEKANG